MYARDYYSALDISDGASQGEIKTAFRRLALKYHPDKNPGDQEAERKFKEIVVAYDVLADPLKRRAYDLSRARGVPYGMDFFMRPGGMGAAMYGRGRGCCGRRGKFGRRAAFVFACVVELSPEEARIGAEREFIMEGPSGFSKVSVAIPPGAENGTVYRVGKAADGFPDEGFDIHIKIV